MYENRTSEFIYQVLYQAPKAYAPVYGNGAYQKLHGVIFFYEVEDGTLVLSEVQGLPCSEEDCGQRSFGFHIHERDLPPLYGSHGMAWNAFFTEQFLPGELIGRTVIIHAVPDDYRTQPDGGAGEGIGSGVILPY